MNYDDSAVYENRSIHTGVDCLKVVALILAGGSGTRLWPLSRQSSPKQLLPLISEKSLLQATSERIRALIPVADQWVITGNDYFFQVKSQLDGVNVLNEPSGKNTAPAIFWMAQICKERFGEDTILVALPSDHLVLKKEAFLEGLKCGIEKAKEQKLVTFGIVPTSPETGYGYIRIDEEISAVINVPCKVQAFIEKPNLEKALEFLLTGQYLWNSGIFAFHVGTLLEEGRKHCADICGLYDFDDATNDSSVAEAYQKVRSCSIDYAVMEQTDKAYTVPVDIGWSDVGSWRSLYKVLEKDENENVVNAESMSLDTTNSLIFGKNKLIVTIGLENTVIVDTDDALLVASMDKIDLMTEMIKALQQADHQTLKVGKTTERPWGSYTILLQGQEFKIKRITVLPGHKLSRQMHYHRNEHWIVLRGTARITNGDQEIYIHENESTYIAKTTPHRLENPGIIPLEIIEIQTGIYLEEDDIVRFEDTYGRMKS